MTAPLSQSALRRYAQEARAQGVVTPGSDTGTPGKRSQSPRKPD